MSEVPERRRRKGFICPCGLEQRLEKSRDKGATGVCNSCLNIKYKPDAEREPSGNYLARWPSCGKSIRRYRLAAMANNAEC